MSAAYYTSGSVWLIVAVLVALVIEGHVHARRVIARARREAERRSR